MEGPHPAVLLPHPVRGAAQSGGGGTPGRERGLQGRQDLPAAVQPLGRRGACLGMWGAVWVSGRRLGMGDTVWMLGPLLTNERMTPPAPRQHLEEASPEAPPTRRVCSTSCDPTTATGSGRPRAGSGSGLAQPLPGPGLPPAHDLHRPSPAALRLTLLPSSLPRPSPTQARGSGAPHAAN